MNLLSILLERSLTIIKKLRIISQSKRGDNLKIFKKIFLSFNFNSKTSKVSELKRQFLKKRDIAVLKIRIKTSNSTNEKRRELIKFDILNYV